jgi:hypothetical protein
MNEGYLVKIDYKLLVSSNFFHLLLTVIGLIIKRFAISLRYQYITFHAQKNKRVECFETHFENWSFCFFVGAKSLS